MNQILINAGPSARGWHRLEAVLRCPQLYAWGYGGFGSNEEKAQRFPPSYPLVRGSIGHVGLAHLYMRKKLVEEGINFDEFYSPLEAMALCANTFGDLGAEALPIASRAVARYAAHYGAEPFTILGVEEAVETEFIGHRYTARVDLIFADRADRVWFTDHKFVNKIESKVYRRYVLSGQFLGLQHLGTRLYGDRFAGVRLNLVGCNDGKFDRTTPEPAPWMLERFPYVVAYAEERIAQVEDIVQKGLVVPASPSEHTCWGSYGECPAFEFCRWGASIFGSGLDDSDL